MADEHYDSQPRKDADAYARYLAGMDASMRQKVALTAAHLLCQGRIADMGMGSGAGSLALAALYPELSVVGVDLDAEIVSRARATHVLPNLSFVAGDIAAKVFGDGELDGIFDSSVLHHVTSYRGYRDDNAADALAVQVTELREHGVLVVRDFVDPGPGTVLLDVRSEDGDASDDPRRCSTAALLRRFAREARVLLPPEKRGFPLEEMPDAPRAGWQRFRLSLHDATEFLLRKDYRDDWETEVQEEYGYYRQDELEGVFARLGLRVLASTPIRNPWIVRNRFRDKMELRDTTGRELDPPATNYVIVGERVPPGEGVRFRVAEDVPPSGFLTHAVMRREGGEARDLVRRPNRTLDVIPFFLDHESLFVIARTSYPRPLLSLLSPPIIPREIEGVRNSIDGVRSSSYVAEPLVVVQTDKPIGQTVEEALLSMARIDEGRIRAFHGGATYYPSPGGVQEEVRSVHVQIEKLFVEERLPAGRIRAIEAQQLLRAAQVGGLPDARLELNVYALLRSLGRAVGPWIGETIALPECAVAARTTMSQLHARAARRAWRSAEREESPGFLELRAARFEELDARGDVVGAQVLEWVMPRRRSASTVACAVLARSGGEIWLGLDDDDLPAAQAFRGRSEILVAPAWRLPSGIATMHEARAFLAERLALEHGVRAAEIAELGGRYHPSPGVTPEVVHPFFVAVESVDATPARALRWVPLRDAIDNARDLVDGHLRIVAHRAAHTLGVLA